MNKLANPVFRIALLLIWIGSVAPVSAQDDGGSMSSGGSSAAERGANRFSAMANLSVLETWIPTKYGLTASYSATESSTFELEYLRASFGLNYFGLDFGSITDQRVSGVWRYYGTKNSFNFFTGMSYTHLDVHLGSKLLETVTSSDRARVDVMKIASLGLTAGIGNRWQTPSGVVWGVDWFVINVPFINLEQSTPFIEATTSEDTRKSVARVIRIFRKIPTFAVAKIQLGVAF